MLTLPVSHDFQSAVSTEITIRKEVKTISADINKPMHKLRVNEY